jgi:hypothetical protein
MRRRVFLLIFTVLLSCGTHDYESAPPDVGPAETIHTPSPTTVNRPPPLPPTVIPSMDQEGYLWEGMRGVGVSDAKVESYMCKLQDRLGVYRMKALGAAMTGGLILGIVIRSSGSWGFFGEPIKPKPKHWFWRNMELGVKTLSQGWIRGTGFAFACDSLLTGRFMPTVGVLGQDFNALAAGATLGGMSAIAAAPYVPRWMEHFFKKGPNRIYRSKGQMWNGIVRVKKWSKSSDIGKGIRYEVLPNLAIIGVGVGVGWLVYEEIQEGDRSGNWCAPLPPN